MHNQVGSRPFVAFELSLEVVTSLRGIVEVVRRHEPSLASQIARSATSIGANLAEGNGRIGRDRTRFFRIAAGSAEETRAHLRLARAWGWVTTNQVEPSLALLDRQVALLWRLTH